MSKDQNPQTENPSKQPSGKGLSVQHLVRLPCPFCGGSDIRFTEHGPMFVQRGENIVRNPDTVWSTCCYDCGATFPNRRKKALLVECWNRRPNSQPNV